MDDIYKNIEEYKTNKKCKILIRFDDMIADMLSNKRFNPIVTELFIRGRKLSLVFIIQFYFAVTNKFFALFLYKNSKKARTSRNFI